MRRSWNSAPAPCARSAFCWTLETPRGYTPIDISGPYLRDVVRLLAADYPGLPMHPLVGDFTLPMTLPSVAGRPTGFFPGSTIGNFRPNAAMAMLRRMREMLNGGGLLVGVDLVKDPKILHAAYNDAAGVTAAFNKNLLARANRDLGADFDLDAFAHYAPYNPQSQAGGNVPDQPEAPARAIHGRANRLRRRRSRTPRKTSHKYTIESFREMAARAGFTPRSVWMGRRPAVCDSLAESR